MKAIIVGAKPSADFSIGDRFGRLVITGWGERRITQSQPTGLLYVSVVCDCGNERVVAMGNLKRGHTKSCGCLSNEKLVERSVTHGATETLLYGVWGNLRSRCQNPKKSNYRRYGGRGINVCEEWDKSFAVFQEWALNNGYAPGLQIDRRDNDNGYRPENCRFVTVVVNSRNRSDNRHITAFGETKTPSEWAEDTRCSVTAHTITNRIRSGIDPEKSITLTDAQNPKWTEDEITRILAPGCPCDRILAQELNRPFASIRNKRASINRLARKTGTDDMFRKATAAGLLIHDFRGTK